MRGRPSPVEEPPTTTLRCTTTPSADAVLATVGAPLRTKGGRRESGGRTVTAGVPDAAGATTTVAGSVASGASTGGEGRALAASTGGAAGSEDASPTIGI